MNLKLILRTIIAVLVIAFAAWAVYLFVVGVPTTLVPEVRPGEMLPPGVAVYRPYRPGVFALLALLPAAIGILREEWVPLGWLSVVLLLAVGALLIFSQGIVFAVQAGMLAVMLGILQQHRSRQQGESDK